MMKFIFIFIAFSSIVGGAYFTATSKIKHPADLSALRLGMNATQIEKIFGVPTAQNRNYLTYILEDSSELTITFRDQIATSAVVKFRNAKRVSDPALRQMTLVQMDPAQTDSGQPNWFFAGKPSEGLIYKISANGIIESLTWVHPFTYPHQGLKNVQSLVRDFKSRKVL